MGMFDDVVVNAKSAVNTVSEKACTFYDISKLKVSSSSTRSELNKKLIELGQLTYASKYGTDVTQEAIDEKIEEVKILKDDLRTINKLLAKAKNLKLCTSCYAAVNKNSVFCSKCGEKLTEVDNNEDDFE